MFVFRLHDAFTVNLFLVCLFLLYLYYFVLVRVDILFMAFVFVVLLYCIIFCVCFPWRFFHGPVPTFCCLVTLNDVIFRVCTFPNRI